MKKLFILGIMCLFLCSCSDKENKEIKPGKISCSEMREIMEYDNNPRLIDVRTEAEYDEGHLDDAMNIPVDSIDSIQNFDSILPDTPIIVYCRSGQRSAKALDELVKLGYTKVYDLGAMSSCAN